MNYRTFIHKDCDKEIFGPLFSRHPRHLKVGTGGHAFHTGTLRQLVDIDYEHKNLALYDDWTGQELYEFVSTEIGDNEYMGAIETSEDQANLMQMYVETIASHQNTEL